MSLDKILLDDHGPRMNIRLADGAIVADAAIPTEELVVALLTWKRTDGRLEVGGTVWRGGYSDGVTGLGETTFAVDAKQLDTPAGRIAVAKQIIAVAA